MREEKEKKTKYYEYFCDICGQNASIDNTELIIEDEGNYNYGDCFLYKTYNYDICSECLKNKIFPYIKRMTKKEPRIEIRVG